MNKDKIDEMFNDLLNRVDKDPDIIILLDYDIMCKFIYTLFAKGHKPLAAKCIHTAADVYGEQLYNDLRNTSLELVKGI